MEHHWQKVASGTIVVSMTAQDLWIAATQYFEWCDTHPIKTTKNILSGKEAGRSFEMKSTRPYTLRALCLHCGIQEEYLKDIRMSKNTSSDYYHVVSRIMYIIYTHNVEMATIGEYNATFVSQVLNLQKDDGPISAITVNVIGGAPALSSSESEILEKLEMENRENEKLFKKKP